MLKLSTMTARSILKKINRRETRILPSINTLTKIVFIALIAITATFFVKNILAANIIQQTQNAQTKGNNSEAWQLNSWNTNSINALTTLTGPIPFNTDGSVDTTKFQVSGLLGTSTKMIASLYNPQASGIEYIAQVKDNFLGKSTYAQGVAFASGKNLQPLLPMWKAFRNIVYSLFSIVFIIIGIMIMLRVKISPQAVITIQNSIPKLITSLVMVTFSYAIAGLVIDISYWIQGFVIALLFSAKGVNPNQSLFNTQWTGLNIGDLVPGQTWFDFKSLSNANFVTLSMMASKAVPALSLMLLGGVVGQIVLGSIIGGLGGLFGSAAGGALNWGGGAVGWLVGCIGGVIFMIIIFILVAIWLIKLFFGLIKTYVTILFQIITAPFMIGMGAFPNSKIGFGSWLIDLISKVAVFPVVLIAMVFINYLVEISGGQLWTPTLLDTGALGGGNVIGAAIGLAGLALLAKLPDLVPEAIFMLKPSPFGKAIGEGLTNNLLIKQGQKTANTIQSSAISNRMDSGSKSLRNKTSKKAKEGAAEAADRATAEDIPETT